ncbi:MAG: hypothetical protein WCX73_04620, partial [Candidatus Pacearchaeota archaeon]
KEIDRMFNLTPMGSSLFEYHPERFKLSGKITIQNTNELLYQGDFKTQDTSFPFYIKRDEDKGKNQDSTSNPLPAASNKI